MQIFYVEYTTAEGREMEMEIEAPNLETAYELVNSNYPELRIGEVYLAEDGEWDGQPDEAQEWESFDVDC